MASLSTAVRRQARCDKKEKALWKKTVQEADSLAIAGNYQDAYVKYLMIFKLSPKYQRLKKRLFIRCLEDIGDRFALSNREQYEFIMKNTMTLCQDVPEITYNIGLHVLKNGLISLGQKSLRYSLAKLRYDDDNYVLVRSTNENICGKLVDRWHYPMLNDRNRNEKYQQAIASTIQKMKETTKEIRVLDIGTGTGILSMMASQAGASSVQACDISTTMIDIARKCSSKENINNILFYDVKSSEMKSEANQNQRCNLLITEIFDAGFFGEHALPSIIDAHNRLLSTNATVIPRSAKVYAVGIECDDIHNGTSVHENRSLISDCDPYTSENMSKVKNGFKVITECVTIYDMDFMKLSDFKKKTKKCLNVFNLTFIEEGRLDAIMVWFDLNLTPDISISSSVQDNSCWQQAIYPIYKEHNITKGQTVKMLVKLYNRSALMIDIVVNEDKSGENINHLCIAKRQKGKLSREEVKLANCSQYQDAYDLAFERLRIDKNTIVVDLHSQYSPNIHRARRVYSKKKYGRQTLRLRELKNDFNEYIKDDMKFVALVNPLLTCGIINDLNEDIKLLAKIPGVHILPERLICQGQLIYSAELVSDSLVDDTNTCGFHIATYLNRYQMTLHQDIQKEALAYEEISDIFQVFDDAVMNLSSDGKWKLNIRPKISGIVNAVIYHYRIQVTEDIYLDLGSQMEFLSSAHVLKKEVKVSHQEDVTLNFIRKLCSLFVVIK